MEECLRLARRFFWAAAVLAWSAFGARGQDAVLLSSTAPGQAPGMVIADGRTFEVPDGAIAILLLRSGELLKIEGPSRGLPKAPAPRSGVSSFWSEMSRAQTADPVAAATRGRPSRIDGASVGEAVVVDVQNSATYCIDALNTVRLRRVSAADWPRGVRRVDGSRVISWQASEPELQWPIELAITAPARRHAPANDRDEPRRRARSTAPTIGRNRVGQKRASRPLPVEGHVLKLARHGVLLCGNRAFQSGLCLRWATIPGS